MYLYRAFAAEIQRLAGTHILAMEEESSSHDMSDTKRVEDDVLGPDSGLPDDQQTILEDVPEAERDTIVVESVDNEEVFKLRAYQDEMLAESLKRNTIIVLNTGAGKTHIALARARAELELDDSDKLAWFLAPTVALCHQHYKSITTNLPAYQTRLLTSEDGVDRWTDQTIWDAILKNMRIVISTYGVLYDALCHGFVNMRRLSLCVFDEAHHCTKKHASNMIMQQFYRPAKSAAQPVPRILGLSASPVMNAKAGGLETLEANMDSHAITPRLHRSELMQYVHVPELVKRSYPNPADFEMPTENTLLGALTTSIHRYDIRKDPYVVGLIQAATFDMQTNVNEVLMSRKTYCTDQLKALRNRAEVIARDVSLSASGTYIQACRHKFLAGVQQNNALWMPELSDKEKSHLAQILADLCVELTSIDTTLSPKLQVLLKILNEEVGPSFTGIIFVEQRAVVAALAEYLTSDPVMSKLFNIGTFVGGSNSSKKKANIGDINDLKAQQQTLDDFRIGKKNLIIATSVLEEGIDVSSCQTVVCFDAPLNLVSFFQRRGRARKKDSKYIILLADDDEKAEPARWHELEDRMKTAYEDEQRNALLAAQLEHVDESDGRKYQVPSTGALLTLDNAKSHLYHFCATLQTSNYVDHRPTFQCRTDVGDLVTAEVLLPSCVDQKYRKAISAHGWRTERAAMKDAAFEACVALHRGGLLNDHLLPLHIQTPDQARQDRPSLIQVAKRLDPWSLGEADLWHEHFVDVEIKGQPKISMAMYLPVLCPAIDDILLHWSMSVKGVASIKAGLPTDLDAESLATKQRNTETLLASVLSATPDSKSYAALFQPLDCTPGTLLGRGSQPASVALSKANDIAEMGLVRQNGQQGRTYVYTSHSETLRSLEVENFPKKRDFLSVPAGESKKNKLTRQELPIDQCTVDVLPVRYSFFVVCIPSILHKVENIVLATHLQNGLLSSIDIKNAQLIVEATTTGAADFTASYERLEYLGDAVLKYCTHIQLAAQHPDWPESYLTAEKGRTNGNASLSRAALKAGVDRYILAQKFTGNKWGPPLLNAGQTDNKTETRSTKTLADVVEALIGASFVDQGLSGALACIRIFLPGEQWLPHQSIHLSLYQNTPQLTSLPAYLSQAQELIGYTFNNPALLLEALTHSSYTTTDSLSYERLEFIGDAVLDQILVPAIFAYKPELKNHEMHRTRQALANAHILGFCCLNLSLPVQRFDAITNDNSVLLQETTETVHLHDFLRCDVAVHMQRSAALTRYHTLRPSLISVLQDGDEYPWPDLLALRLPKWISDLVETVLGAIFVDSQGNLASCRAFVSRCGILDLLQRFLDDGVAVGFPKERLGMLADKEKVAYEAFVVEAQKDKEEGGDEKVGWGCRVLVGGVEVVVTRGCCSREEAEVRGAVEAVRVLQFERIRRMEEDAVIQEGDEDGDREMVDV